MTELTDDERKTRRTIWVAVGVLVIVLLAAGLLHLAYSMSAALYVGLRETDEKQTKWIGELYRRQTELERKLAVFEANLKYEAEAAQKRIGK
jgi:flagellar basal body-associated protein FliL